MAETQMPQYLVVIGSSAGGIEALSTLVGSLPEDFPAPIVIAQHLDPSRRSHLGEIMSRRATLAVRTVEDREPLEPGVIYVVPANRHVLITDSEVVVRTEERGGSRPSIDLLLRSAAQVYGEQLIAVILTGSGTDGAAGAREVHTTGGTVIIQNPETAPFPAMPLSLAPTDVDIIANVENIGAILDDLTTGRLAHPRPSEERAFRMLLDQLRERSGIDFGSYKTPTIMRRLQRRMIATGSDRLTEYNRYLVSHPEEYQRLVSSFLIKVTEFFRDAELFDYLRDHALPELIAEARARDNELRVWSAGCATGEEAYSLAILLCELLGDEMEQFQVRIFATDLDNDAITFARRGIYPASTLANVPPAFIERYFTNVEGDYEVKKSVRALTVFGQHDLGQRAPFPRIDLALCRNVLIYFTTELQKRALQLFAFSLRDGGLLVLGKAETTNPLAEYFALEQPQLKVYQRRGDRILIPPARIRDTAPIASIRATQARVPPTAGDPGRPVRDGQRARSPREKAEAVLLGMSVGIIVTDRRYDIQVINAAARRLFGIHTTAIGEDFIHLVRTVPSATLRTAIDAAFRGETTGMGEEIATTQATTGEVQYLEVRCYPQKLEGGAEAVDSVLVMATDVTDGAQERRNLEAALTRQREETDRISALMRRVGDANRDLLQANQELSTSNIELRSANEEFLVASEEAQAATEEIETLNEELQATNEELETLNEELQATVEELNTTNDDLQARTVELQETAISLEIQRRASETERERLSAIVYGIGEAVVVVDAAGQTVLTNDRYADLFGNEETNLGARDAQGNPFPHRRTLQQRAAAGESFSMTFSVTAPDGTLRHFEANGQPIQSEERQGGVVVIREITDQSALDGPAG